jgi:hypothetical protein
MALYPRRLSSLYLMLQEQHEMSQDVQNFSSEVANNVYTLTYKSQTSILKVKN